MLIILRCSSTARQGIDEKAGDEEEWPNAVIKGLGKQKMLERINLTFSSVILGRVMYATWGAVTDGQSCALT